MGVTKTKNNENKRIYSAEKVSSNLNIFMIFLGWAIISVFYFYFAMEQVRLYYILYCFYPINVCTWTWKLRAQKNKQ